MNVNRWQRTGYGVGGLAALAVLFLGVVMLSNGLLRGVRLDLTQNRLYTLTPGTKAVLAELKEPVNLYYYFSRDAAAKQSPLLMLPCTSGWPAPTPPTAARRSRVFKPNARNSSNTTWRNSSMNWARRRNR